MSNPHQVRIIQDLHFYDLQIAVNDWLLKNTDREIKDIQYTHIRDDKHECFIYTAYIHYV